MKQKILSRGAEAVITQSGKKVLKTRIPKSYRLPILDEKIRKSRTKAEAKILTKASEIIPVPSLLKTDKYELTLQYISGKKLSEHLDSLPKSSQTFVCKQIGKNLALLHNAGLIHGDLTTSNLILSNSARSPTISKKLKVYMIDFGLGFHSNKPEDKAVDLHLIKQALEAKHHKNFERFFKLILDSYTKHSQHSKQVLTRLEKVEKRGRYKQQY